MADRGGYIGRNPGDAAIIVARETFEPTGVQTDFTFAAGYTVGYMDVYINGIRQINGLDYTASSGSTVGLTSAANNGDVLELVAYKAFNLGQSIDQVTGNFDLNGKLTVTGISSLTDVVSSGIVTADSFYGDGSNLSGLSTAAVPGISTQLNSKFGTVQVSGITTISNTTASTSSSTGALIISGGVGIAKSLFVGEGISVGGTITYDDVTNIDSIGIVTAGGGLYVGRTSIGVTATTAGHIIAAGVITATSFAGDGSNLSGISTAAVPGISTQLHSNFGTINASGIITASAFKGDGSTLSNVGGDTDITSCLFI